MITASELAGFFAAHAIWCVSEGDTLIPMLAYTTLDGQRKMDRLVFDNPADAVAFGRMKLASNEMGADDCVLVYDGRIPVGNEKLDAIILELRTVFSPNSQMTIAIPYTPKHIQPFRVHKPKLLEWEHCEDFDLDYAFESFFKGMAGHEKGAEIWNTSVDESK